MKLSPVSVSPLLTSKALKVVPHHPHHPQQILTRLLVLSLKHITDLDGLHQISHMLRVKAISDASNLIQENVMY